MKVMYVSMPRALTIFHPFENVKFDGHSLRQRRQGNFLIER